MPDERISLAHQIRNKVDAGVLPRVLPEKLWNAYGQGSPCHGCDQPIHPAQTQYGFFQESGDVIPLHIGCLGMWIAELRRTRAPSL